MDWIREFLLRFNSSYKKNDIVGNSLPFKNKLFGLFYIFSNSYWMCDA